MEDLKSLSIKQLQDKVTENNKRIDTEDLRPLEIQALIDENTEIEDELATRTKDNIIITPVLNTHTIGEHVRPVNKGNLFGSRLIL